jgi:hypothetical protein
LALRAITLEPIPRFGLGAILGVVPHLVAVETCSFGFHPNISFGLAPFERNPLLHKVPLGFKPRALELFGLIFGWASLPTVPFAVMPWFLVKEFIVLLELGFFTSPHI